MKLTAAHVGHYPRIGESAEEQLLRRTTRQWEKGNRSALELREAQEQVTRAALREQSEAGLDEVTDGLIRWYDPLSHLAAKLTGIRIGGLLRFFDTNFYFRQPEVHDIVSWNGPILREEYEFASRETSKPVRVVLTGPYTLAKLSVSRTGRYHGVEDLAASYAEALGRELAELADAGAKRIQIDEPAVLRHPDEFGILAEAIALVARHKGNAELILMTYFGEAEPLYQKLMELPVEEVGFDFTYSPGLVDRVASQGASRRLGLGLIDGRNTGMESVDRVLATLERLEPGLRESGATLTPSCGLEYLPRDRARRKLHLVAELRDRFNSGGQV